MRAPSSIAYQQFRAPGWFGSSLRGLGDISAFASQFASAIEAKGWKVESTRISSDGANANLQIWLGQDPRIGDIGSVVWTLTAYHVAEGVDKAVADADLVLRQDRDNALITRPTPVTAPSYYAPAQALPTSSDSKVPMQTPATTSSVIQQQVIRESGVVEAKPAPESSVTDLFKSVPTWVWIVAAGGAAFLLMKGGK